MSEMEFDFGVIPERANTSGIPAKYDGWCKACGNAIWQGTDLITYDQQYDAYVHLGCYTEPTPTSEPMPQGMCMVCWQARAANGTCGCL